MEVIDGNEVAELTAFLRFGGSLNVLGLISVSIELYLGLRFQLDTNVLWGQARLTIEVDLIFFSPSIDIEVERQIAGPAQNAMSSGLGVAQDGGGLGSFAELISRDAWLQHAAAFVGAALGPAPEPPAPPPIPPSGDTISVRLDEGWNLVGWNGDPTAVVEALLPLGDAFSDAFTYEPSDAEFLRYSPGAPSFINTLDMLPRSAGVWILASRAAVWEQPAGAAVTSVDLLPGFNLVAWRGPATPAAEAFAAISAQLIAVFTYETASELFRSYAPNRPAVLNDLDSLQPGDGVWLNMAQAASWRPAPDRRGAPDGNATNPDLDRAPQRRRRQHCRANAAAVRLPLPAPLHRRSDAPRPDDVPRLPRLARDPAQLLGPVRRRLAHPRHPPRRAALLGALGGALPVRTPSCGPGSSKRHCCRGPSAPTPWPTWSTSCATATAPWLRPTATKSLPCNRWPAPRGSVRSRSEPRSSLGSPPFPSVRTRPPCARNWKESFSRTLRSLPAPPDPARDFLQVRLFHERRTQKRLPALTPPALDFHQALSAMAEYPVLLRRLGLVHDLQIPSSGDVPIGPTTVQVLVEWKPGVVPTETVPNPLAGASPRLDTRCVVATDGFSAAPRNFAPDIADGALRLDAKGAYTVVQVDHDGAALKAGRFRGQPAALGPDAPRTTRRIGSRRRPCARPASPSRGRDRPRTPAPAGCATWAGSRRCKPPGTPCWTTRTWRAAGRSTPSTTSATPGTRSASGSATTELMGLTLICSPSPMRAVCRAVCRHSPTAHNRTSSRPRRSSTGAAGA